MALMTAPVETREVEVYWLRDLHIPQTGPTLPAIYAEWRPWIMAMGDYYEPSDPLHTTLNVTTQTDPLYDQQWGTDMEGTGQQVNYSNIYVGREGVGSLVHLTPTQKEWYRLHADSIPHATLAVGNHHLAKNLGAFMIRVARPVSPWPP